MIPYISLGAGFFSTSLIFKLVYLALLRNEWATCHFMLKPTLLVRFTSNLLWTKYGPAWDFLSRAYQTGSVLGPAEEWASNRAILPAGHS